MYKNQFSKNRRNKQTREREREINGLLTFETGRLLDFLKRSRQKSTILTIPQDTDIKGNARWRGKKMVVARKDGEMGQGAEVRRRKENGHGCLQPSFSLFAVFLLSRDDRSIVTAAPSSPFRLPFRARFVIRDSRSTR